MPTTNTAATSLETLRSAWERACQITDSYTDLPTWKTQDLKRAFRAEQYAQDRFVRATENRRKAAFELTLLRELSAALGGV